MMDSIKYFLILMKAKINKKLQRKYFIFKDSYKNIEFKRFSDLYLTELSDNIYIYIDLSLAKEKNVLLKIIKKLINQGKNIFIIELVKVLSDDDILNLYNLSKKIVFVDLYLEKTKELAKNQIIETDISSYVLIIDKLKYFKTACEHFCKNDLDKIIFSAVQIANYVRYTDVSEGNSCLANCFILKSGVCIDIAIGLLTCLERLNIKSELVKGIGNNNKTENLNPLQRFNHAWNQVKINENWYNIDLTWYMSLKVLDDFLVEDKIFYRKNLHKTTTANHICRQSIDKEYIQKKIDEYSKIKNIFMQYDNNISINEIIN